MAFWLRSIILRGRMLGFHKFWGAAGQLQLRVMFDGKNVPLSGLLCQIWSNDTGIDGDPKTLGPCPLDVADIVLSMIG